MSLITAQISQLRQAITAAHGLGLQDAAGLLSLADNATDAERIAARFAAVPRAQSREDTTS